MSAEGDFSKVINIYFVDSLIVDLNGIRPTIKNHTIVTFHFCTTNSLCERFEHNEVRLIDFHYLHYFWDSRPSFTTEFLSSPLSSPLSVGRPRFELHLFWRKLITCQYIIGSIDNSSGNNNFRDFIFINTITFRIREVERGLYQSPRG